jgi:molybdopterin converting factor small subunit
MSDTPIFDKLIAEYGKNILGILERPFLAEVKSPLPQRTVSPLIQVPEPDPEFTRKFQEFITTAPMQILAKTPAGSFIQNMQPVRTEDGGITLEAVVAIPTVDQREQEKEMVPPILRSLSEKAKNIRGMTPGVAIVDEVARFQETGLVDPVIQYELDQGAIAYTGEEGERVTKVKIDKDRVSIHRILTEEEIVDGKTESDVIQELGQEFSEKYPDFEVEEVLVSEDFGSKTILVKGRKTEQTDETVNAASNEETDGENQPVILTPDFWKIRDEE